VTVYDSVPYFTSLPLPSYKMALNEVKNITINQIADLENDPITMTF